MVNTTVHLVRHGEVHNPGGVLYGRIPGFHLSERGHQMAARIAEFFTSPQQERSIAAVIASPLQRAQETASPLATALGLELGTDERLLEAANHFEGLTVGAGAGALTNPRHWPYLWNPFRPSWGEPYRDQVSRMSAAVGAAREGGRGHDVVLVSHQLPIWVTRLHFEGRRLWHDPRHRECTLTSVTSLNFSGDELVSVTYREPAADLLPGSATIAGA